jgi:uncharacterized protein YjiS (DUF1127 family)
MTDMTIGAGYAAPAPFASRLGGRLAALIAGVREHFRIRRDIAVLSGLDDRMLADIGLKRTEIESAARYGRN